MRRGGAPSAGVVYPSGTAGIGREGSGSAESAGDKAAMIRIVMRIAALLALIAITALPGASQSNPDLETFFRQSIGLDRDQIAAIRSGQPVAMTLPPRTPASI